MKKLLSDKQKAMLEALADMPDELIDFSDIPEAGEEAWKDSTKGKFYRPIKKQVTVRIDADILAWLQADGKGYQKRLNRALRKVMRQDMQQL